MLQVRFLGWVAGWVGYGCGGAKEGRKEGGWGGGTEKAPCTRLSGLGCGQINGGPLAELTAGRWVPLRLKSNYRAAIMKGGGEEVGGRRTLSDSIRAAEVKKKKKKRTSNKKTPGLICCNFVQTFHTKG